MSGQAARRRIQPRLLTKQDAADYCSVSVPIFDQVCPVKPVRLMDGRERLLRYDVVDLDRWIEDRKGNGASSSADAWLDRLGNGGRSGEGG